MEQADFVGAWIMGLAQIPLIINFFWSIRHGEKVNDNPWEATTLEWTAPSPPPHGNFITPPVASPMNTAFRAASAITRCKTNRWNQRNNRAASRRPSLAYCDSRAEVRSEIE